MTGPATVVLADDHARMRETVAELLTGNGFDVVGQAGSAAEAVELAQRTRPSICILDINMPGGGVEAAGTIAGSLPDTAVVMLTVHVDDDHLFDALRAGARGYLVKGSDPDAMVGALRNLAAGEPGFSPGIAMRLVERLHTASGGRRVTVPGRGSVALSPREAEVLDLLRQGRSTSQIARALYVSPVTVRSHVAALVRKLDVTDRDALLRLFAN